MVKSKAIEDTLAKVLEIDYASVEMEHKIEELKVLKEKELKKKQRELDLSHMKDARKKAKEAYDKVLEVAQKQEAEIMDEGAMYDQRIRRRFEKTVDDLVEEAMVQIFGRELVHQKE